MFALMFAGAALIAGRLPRTMGSPGNDRIGVLASALGTFVRVRACAATLCGPWSSTLAIDNSVGE